MNASTAIFWPIIAHVAMVFAIYRLLFARRVQAVKAGTASPTAFRENRQEPIESVVIRNSLQNQFESPTLFYVVCLSLFVTGHATLYPVLLAWGWVMARLIHAYIHITTNRIRHRLPAFVAGAAILALMWLWLAVKLVTG
jgi:hypothetical protein